MIDTAPLGAEHLCVLIHGLWGNPEHLKYLDTSLREHCGTDNIRTLVCESNSGNFTYDGIDVGAERVATEIKSHLKNLEADGHQIKKFSIVGYSLGGLVARYVIGLLDHDGFFDKISPVNFTTFASPHLGVRSPLGLWTSYIFNNFGPHLTSASGRQLYVTDKFRDTGKPLLAVLADPNSIFLRALARFERRTLYANIVNDRLANFYTCGISATDPYQDLTKINCNYVEGYAPVVIDGSEPFKPLDSDRTRKSRNTSLAQTAQTSARTVATAMAMTVIFPIFLTGFLGTSAVETYRSQRRIKMHSTDESFERHRVPYLLQRMTSNMEAQANNLVRMPSRIGEKLAPAVSEASAESSEMSKTLTGQRSQEEPVGRLPLLESQFDMIKGLDDVGFHKYHVWIHESNWSHAAIVVRKQNSNFGEGKVVVRHWVENEFRL